jgi:hypothetical protein
MTLEQSRRTNIVFVTLSILGVFAFVSDDDYHKQFDIITPVKYNCDMLIGGWHPDVPSKVIDECRKQKEKNVKTY